MASNQSFCSYPVPDGVYAAVLMPFHQNLSCNEQILLQHCLDLIKRGCNGVVLFGTTGEGPSLSLEEKLFILDRIVADGRLDPKKVLLANGSSGILDTVSLAKEGLKKGCAAMLIAPPSFYKNVSDEGVLAFYKDIIQKVSDPNFRVILYHIPQFSGVGISLNTIQALRQEFPETVIGIKESAGDLALTKAILKAFPGFQVFVGYETQIIESVSLGGSGAICGLANLYPEQISSLFSQGKKAYCSNPKEIELFFQTLKDLHFISAFKAVMEHRQGAAWHALRPPLVSLSGPEEQQFISSLQKYGLEQ